MVRGSCANTDEAIAAIATARLKIRESMSLLSVREWVSYAKESSMEVDAEGSTGVGGPVRWYLYLSMMLSRLHREEYWVPAARGAT